MATTIIHVTINDDPGHYPTRGFFDVMEARKCEYQFVEVNNPLRNGHSRIELHISKENGWFMKIHGNCLKDCCMRFWKLIPDLMRDEKFYP